MSKTTPRDDLSRFFDSLSPDDEKRCYLTVAEICKDFPGAVIDQDYVNKLKAEGVKAWPPAH